MWRRMALIMAAVGGFLAAGASSGARAIPAAAQQNGGTIAYVRGGEEIRLIQPDGGNDHSIWVEPNPDISYQITGLDWRPDAGALAFSSNHEEACSLFQDDIYSIWPDGSGLRRVTNAPRCADLTAYPKGRVTVGVENLTGGGPFFVYIQGAPSAQFALVPAGGTTTVTFDDVADFGNTLQQAVVINGFYRWIAPITAVDVLPGQTVHAGTLQVSGGGIRPFGGHAPAWRPDGGQIGYIFGDCAGMWGVAPAPPPGIVGDPLLSATNVFACLMDWGPAPAHANQILYWSYLAGGIYLVTAGSGDAGTQLVATDGTENVYDIEWLPDGSGFLFTKTGDYLTNANVYRYDFASGMVSPLTQFAGAFTRNVAISPDGQSVVFDLAAAPDSFESDLIMMNQDGTNQRLLVNNGRLPTWSPRAVQLPSAIYLPFVVH